MIRAAAIFCLMFFLWLALAVQYAFSQTPITLLDNQGKPFANLPSAVYKVTPNKLTDAVTGVVTPTPDTYQLVAWDCTNNPGYAQCQKPKPPVSTWKLVYTRQPYNSTPIPGNTADSELANFQNASDVRRINDLLDEADLVIDDLAGNTKVLFDCTGNKSLNCVAQEGKVSHDGTRIAYSLGFSAPGSAGLDMQFGGLKPGLQPLVCAQIYVYNLTTGTNTPVPNHPGGDCAANDGKTRAIDRQPTWLSNTELVFISNRGNKWPNREGGNQHLQFCNNYPYCVSQTYPYGDAGKAMQLWKMNTDGTAAVNWGPEHLNTLSPEVMTNGDVMFTTWIAHADKGFYPGQNAQVALPNLMWLVRLDGNGADIGVKLHGHKQDIVKAKDWLPVEPTIGGVSKTKGGLIGYEQLRGLRSIAEIFPGKLAISSYYRANHNGSNGAIYGLDYGDPLVEGCRTAACIKFPYQLPASTALGSGAFIPSTLKSITPWGQSGDSMPGFMFSGPGKPLRSFGKAGYAAPYDKDSFLITHRLGQCYAAAGGDQVTKTWLGESSVCRGRIMRVKAPNGLVPVTTNPFDTAQMEPLVDDPRYQVWDAKPIKTYQELYGQAAPTRPAPLDASKACYLQVVNARNSEIYGREGQYPQATSTMRCAWQGCAVQPQTENPDYIKNNMAFFRITLPELFDFPYTGNNEKYKMTMNTLGFKDMYAWSRTQLQSDGSVKVQVPCDTPLLMSGENLNGEVIAHDDMVQSLRPGETRTCHGCHDGHSEERFAELGKIPATERFKTTAAAAAPAGMGAKTPLPKFKDVQPILTSTCGTCHTGFENDPLLYSRVVWDTKQRDFAWMPKVKAMPGVGDGVTLWRPLTSRFVSKFALESPLYWYAANRRTDGRLNADRDWDIDYKDGHPDSLVTMEQRNVIKDWLDNGAAY